MTLRVPFTAEPAAAVGNSVAVSIPEVPAASSSGAPQNLTDWLAAPGLLLPTNDERLMRSHVEDRDHGAAAAAGRACPPG